MCAFEDLEDFAKFRYIGMMIPLMYFKVERNFDVVLSENLIAMFCVNKDFMRENWFYCHFHESILKL